MPPQNIQPRIDYLRSSALPGTELLIGENDTSMWHVFHERYAICACETVATNYRYRGKVISLDEDGIMLLEPGETHRNLVIGKPAGFRVLFIDPGDFASTAKEQGLPATPHFPVPARPDPRLTAALYRLSASIEAQDSILEQQSRLAIFLRLVLGYAEQSLPERSANECSAVERAKAYLTERFNEPVSLDELAAIAGLSPFHLVRSFTREFGLPPHALQIQLRISRARALLRAGESPMAVAFDVGFADQSHFTRHFKKIWRTTPAAYARAGEVKKEIAVV
jgi:AraC-like DNA-binding protein